jgi:hypothetical protein
LKKDDTKKMLTAQQRRAIEALLTHGTTTAAAEAAGVQRKTVYRWKQQPEFIEALAEAERAAVERLSRDLAGLSAQAAEVLRDAMRPGQKMSNRLRAVEIVIGRLVDLRGLVEIEKRLEQLENA